MASHFSSSATRLAASFAACNGDRAVTHSPREEKNAAFELTVRFEEENTGPGRMITVQIDATRFSNGEAADELVSLKTGYYLPQR